MKKLILAVIAVFAMSLSFTSCSKSKADQMLDDMEAIVEKVEKATSEADAMSAALEMMSLGEKYKDLGDNDFTEAQQQRAQELDKRIEAAMEKFKSEVEEAAEAVEEAVGDAVEGTTE